MPSNKTVGALKLHKEQNFTSAKGVQGLYVSWKKSCTDDYRYGFNGQEKDNEIKGDANSLNYKHRMADTRLCRFFGVDPIARDYPELTVYQMSSLNPIWMIELEGLEGVKFPDAQGIPNSADNTNVQQKPFTGNLPVTSSEAPAWDVTISAGKQIGIGVNAGKLKVGGEVNFGSTTVATMSNVRSTGMQGNLSSGWSFNVCLIGLGDEYNTTFSKQQVNGSFGLPSSVTTATTENKSQFSIGLKGTPLSLGINNTTTYTQSMQTLNNGIQLGWSKPKLINSTPGVNVGFSATPYGYKNKGNGIGFNVAVGYKIEVQVYPKQAAKSMFNWFNMSGGGGGF
jgi:RHS repeat-associated protein